jgi:nucleotide-binding universal stress UspA family protein
MADNAQPIVCGTDFSPSSIEAADVACALAKRLNTKLVLVHVAAIRGLGPLDPVLIQSAMVDERSAMDREIARLGGCGVELESQLRSGSPYDELVTAATEVNARSIVLGAVGHGLGHRLLIGSVAERTAETSRVPTVIVRPGGNLLPWLEGKHALKVLLGYDFSPAADAALQWIGRLRKDDPSCEINVAHIYWSTEIAARFGYKEKVRFGDNPEELQGPLREEIQERVSKFMPAESVKITVQPATGSQEGSLYEISHDEQVDLIVIGTHQRAGLGRLRFGSVSRAVVHHAQVSVVVVPPPPEQRGGAAELIG